MSVLEKIVQAEKEASALLVSSREKASLINREAQDQLDALKINNAKEVAVALHALNEQANKDIALYNKEIEAKKAKVIVATSESAKNKKQKVVDEIFKDITAL